jgi:hypothetical protein
MNLRILPSDLLMLILIAYLLHSKPRNLHLAKSVQAKRITGEGIGYEERSKLPWSSCIP